VVTRIDDVESDAYFASRPRGSQIGAWASPQSQPIVDRSELERLVEAQTNAFEGRTVPRPEFWGGWVLRPVTMEFWQGRPSRLHDRFRYERVNDRWTITRLAP
jgi:pyridoxamine 5'-phosphate oxidase